MIAKSKKIYIHVKDGISIPGSDEYFKRSRNISSVYDENRRVLIPLNEEEQKQLMPYLINTVPEDVKFREKVLDYFTNISQPVFQHEPLKLEVGFEYESEDDYAKEKAEFDKNGYLTSSSKILGKRPINIADYVLYRFALRSSKVANDKEYAYSSRNIWFYIQDEGAELKAKQRFISIKTEAMELFFTKVAKDKNVQCAIINSSLSFLPKMNGRYAEDLGDELPVFIDELLTKEPERFITLAKSDPENLAFRGLIGRALAKGVLKKLPNTDIITYESSDGVITIGNKLSEAVAFLKHEQNVVIKNKIELAVR